MQLYKVIRKDMKPAHGGKGQWAVGETRREGPGQLKPAHLGFSLADHNSVMWWMYDVNMTWGELDIYEVASTGDEVYEFDDRAAPYRTVYQARQVTIGRKVGTVTKRAMIEFCLGFVDIADYYTPWGLDIAHAVWRGDSDYVEAHYRDYAATLDDFPGFYPICLARLFSREGRPTDVLESVIGLIAYEGGATPEAVGQWFMYCVETYGND